MQLARAVMDPYKSEQAYERWKKQKIIDGLSRKNKELIRSYLYDMEKGVNVSPHSKKGGRSYKRLNTTARTNASTIYESHCNNGYEDSKEENDT